jgi:ABC-type phosphate transport system substrate-binding protein
MTRMTRFAVTFAVAAGGVLAARAASAQDAGTNPTCASLMNPVYLDGSSAFGPTVQVFAAKLLAEASPITIVYLQPGSCSGVNVIATKADITGTGIYYPTSTTTGTCTLPPSGQKADIGVSDVFYGSCGANVPATMPPDLKDFPGPVQAMEFIVPKANTTTGYLTAAEAQDIYGCGPTADVATFTSAAGIFCRNQDSGTQIIISDNIGLPAALPFACVSATGSGALATAVAGYSIANASIGFLGADVYDKNRMFLNALAFQAVGQTGAFYADSNSSIKDRQNVRDGHYPMWGYEHMMTYVGGDGTTPVNANAAKVINLILGTTSDANVGDYVQLEGAAGTVPLCAMGVQKHNDSPGYLSATTAPTCTCAYVKAASGTAPTGCVACGGGSDGGADAAVGGCTGGKTCQHGFCE